ncbi:MAG TPA: helix-turn-helix domain-containing protein [Methylomirabilota bacterium]|nr:helix-turn-helix domain-containing protein [Methylomirabilota bacterium]
MHKGHNANDLVGSLEELGLSRYEAGAYLTMIRKGSLAASEISYYANLPRTKVYSTLKKLEKKRLSIVSQSKPLICSAIPPEEAFRDIVKLYERRSKNMKKIVDRLQKITEEQKPKASEERRYYILDPNSTLEKMKSLIANSKTSVLAILDSWGIQLITQCKLAMIKAITNGVKIRLLLANQCIGNENLPLLPEDVDLKIGNVSSNVIIIDSNNMVAVDSSNGKAALFASIDIFGLSQLNSFETEWNNALEVRQIVNMQPRIVMKANKLVKIVENANVHEQISKNWDEPTSALIKSAQKYGVEIFDSGIDEMLTVIDCALHISCSGDLTHDKINNILSIRSKVGSESISGWVLLLASYLKHVGNDPKIIRDFKNNGIEDTIHIKLSKPIRSTE